MAVMYSFCRYFSVRLGSLVVAISSMIQSLSLLGLLFFWLHDVEETRDSIAELVSEFDFIYMEDILIHIIKSGPSMVFKVAVVFLLFHMSTCVLLAYGAIKCNVPFIWPFLFMEFVRLILLFLFHITTMIFIKNNSYDLGLLVGLCLLGSFILLELFYMWFCVYSLSQCIQALNQSPTKDNQQKEKKPSLNFFGNNFYLSDFKCHISLFSAVPFGKRSTTTNLLFNNSIYLVDRHSNKATNIAYSSKYLC